MTRFQILIPYRRGHCPSLPRRIPSARCPSYRLRSLSVLLAVAARCGRCWRQARWAFTLQHASFNCGLGQTHDCCCIFAGLLCSIRLCPIAYQNRVCSPRCIPVVRSLVEATRHPDPGSRSTPPLPLRTRAGVFRLVGSTLWPLVDSYRVVHIHVVVIISSLIRRFPHSAYIEPDMFLPGVEART